MQRRSHNDALPRSFFWCRDNRILNKKQKQKVCRRGILFLKSLIYCFAVRTIYCACTSYKQPVTTQKTTWYKPGMTRWVSRSTPTSPNPKTYTWYICTNSKYIPGTNDGITFYTKKSPHKKSHELRTNLRSLRDKKKENRHRPVPRGSKPLQTTYHCVALHGTTRHKKIGARKHPFVAVETTLLLHQNQLKPYQPVVVYC